MQSDLHHPLNTPCSGIVPSVGKAGFRPKSEVQELVGGGAFEHIETTGFPRAVRAFRSRRSDLLFSCDPSSAVASSSSWTSSASEILLGGVLDHLRDGGVAAIRVGAGTAQIRRVFGEILNINSHGGSGELPISAVALLAVVERGLYCSQSAQNLARRAAAP